MFYKWHIYLFFCLVLNSSAVYTQIIPNAYYRHNYIDELIFPTTVKHKNIDNLIKQGYSGFILDTLSKISENELDFIDNYLLQNQSKILVFIQKKGGDITGNLILSRFEKKICFSNDGPLLLYNTIIDRRQQILFFSEGTIQNGFAEKVITHVNLGRYFPMDIKEIFIKNSPGSMFTLLHFNPEFQPEKVNTGFLNTTVEEAIINYLLKTGKFANFVLTDNPESLDNLKNNIPFYVKVNVMSNDEINEPSVDPVRWNISPDLESFGIAHIVKSDARPLEHNLTLNVFDVMPDKPGYYFVPEMLTCTRSRFNEIYPFEEIKLKPTDGLEFFFLLNNNRLKSTPQVSGPVKNTAKVRRDKSIGKYFYFNGRNSIWFQSDAFNSRTKAISVSFWAKPENESDVTAFFSKNNSFSIRSDSGKVSIAFPRREKCTSQKANLTFGEWQHITVVLPVSGSVKFYMNGEFIDQIPNSQFINSDGGYYIGNNQYNKYFTGGIKELGVWSRALSDSEIRFVYKGEMVKEIKNAVFPLLGFSIIALITIITFILLYYKKSGSYYKPRSIIKTAIKPQTNCILCMGTFHIFNEKGKNLAEKIPEKKKGFILTVLYYSIKYEGINLQEISNLLWPNFDPVQTKNLRSTYLHYIRYLIPESLFQIIYHNKMYTLKPGADCFIDFYEIVKLQAIIELSDDINEEVINNYIDLIENGGFASDLNYEEINEIKENVNSNIINTLEILLIKKNIINENLRLRICDTIILFDPINEDAAYEKIRIYKRSNQKNKAIKQYKDFNKNWEKVMNEPWKQKYSDL